MRKMLKLLLFMMIPFTIVALLYHMEHGGCHGVCGKKKKKDKIKN